MLSVAVKTLDGNNRSFDLSDETTVRQFKDSIHREMDIPVDQIRLIFQGKVMQEDHLLKDIGVDGKVVHLVRREPPMASGSRSHSSSRAPGPSAAGSVPTERETASLEEQLSAESLRAMIQEILSGMGEVARMATVVTEQSEDGGFDIQVNIPPAVPRRSLARMRQRYVGAIEGQARAVARWLEDPGRYTRPQPDYVVLRRSERSVDPTVDEAEPAAEAEEGSADGSATVVDPVSASELSDLLDSVDGVWGNIRTLVERWQRLLREDPPLDTDNDVNTERQRLYDGVSRLLHLQSHMLHHISDFIVEFGNAPPRRLLVMAETPMQSFSVRINVDMEQFGSADLRSGLRPTPRRFPAPQPAAPNANTPPGVRFASAAGAAGRAGAAAATALPLLRFVLPTGAGGSQEGAASVVTGGAGLHPGVRAQRGQTADGTGYVWASAGPHIDYELRPDIFAVNSSWTHIFSDTGQQPTPQPPQPPPPPTSRASAAQPRSGRSLDVQAGPQEPSQPPPAAQATPREQGGSEARQTNFQRDMYSRVLEQALRQSLQATHAAMDADQGRYGAAGEQVLGAAVVGQGNTWTSVDPYLPCNSRHFVEFVTPRGMEVGGRRIFLGTPFPPPFMEQRGRQPPNAAAPAAQPEPPARQSAAQAWMGALGRLLAETGLDLRAAASGPPGRPRNLLLDTAAAVADSLGAGAVLNDASALDRLRTPLRSLFRARLVHAPAGRQEAVRAVVTEAVSDAALRQHPAAARAAPVLASWLHERVEGEAVEWRATLEPLSIWYAAQLILLTLDSPTDVGFGQMLVDEMTTFLHQAYALLRHAASAADLLDLCQRVALALADGSAATEASIRTLSAAFHQTLENAYQTMPQSERTSLLDRWLVRPAPSVPMELDEEDEGFRTPPEEVVPHTAHAPAATELPERPLEAHSHAAAFPPPDEEAPLPAEWRDILPPDWLGVIAHDLPSRSADAPEDTPSPLSDAYVAGMPAKRRRLMLAARSMRQPGPARSMLQDVLREALEAGAGQAASTEASTPEPGLERAFREYTRERVGERLAGNADYDEARFPEVERMFGGEMRKTKKKKK